MERKRGINKQTVVATNQNSVESRSQGHSEIFLKRIDFPPVLNAKVSPGKMRTEWIELDLVVKKS